MTPTSNLVNRIISSTIAGLIAVIVGFTSSIALIYQMVIDLGGNVELASSWLLALGLSMGLTSIGLSLFYKVPILIAWSTPGVALLLADASNYNLNEAIAGFMISALLIFVSGITAWFEKLADKIPFQLASAMLAGILINFGIEVFNQMNQQPFLVISMLFVYWISKQIIPRFTMLSVLVVGILLSWQLDLTNPIESSTSLSGFQYISPEFTFDALLGIGLPLFIVTMAAQNLPGIAVLKAHHYKTPVSSVMSTTGAVNFVTAPFGCYAINLAAITAAICMTNEVSDKPSERYWAAISGGFFYIVMAIFSGFLMSAFSALPTALIYALAGIALFSTISNSIQQSLTDNRYLEASMITLLVTASDLSLWGISSVLWGLILGSVTIIIQSALKNN